MPADLLSLFRSAVVLSDAVPGEQRPGIPFAKLLQWLPRWDALLKERLGIRDGSNLHLLYGRALTILSPSVRQYGEELAELGQLARELGLTVAVNLSVAEGLDPNSQVTGLLQRALVSTVYLDAREAPEAADGSAVQELVRNLRQGGASPALVGPVARWMSWGLLDAPFLNAGTVHMAPGGRSNLLPLRADGPDPFEIRHAFDPCKERFAVFVGPDGTLYPCHGLVGIEQFRIGALDEDVPLRISGFQADMLKGWASHGPGCPGCVEPDPDSPFPPVCELHKTALLGSQGARAERRGGIAACGVTQTPDSPSCDPGR